MLSESVVRIRYKSKFDCSLTVYCKILNFHLIYFHRLDNSVTKCYTDLTLCNILSTKLNVNVFFLVV